MTKPLTFDGRTQSMSAWARELNTSQQALAHRLRNGWSVEQALTTPVSATGNPMMRRGTPRLVTFNGKTQMLSAWARELGLQLGTLSARLRKGMSVERALTPSSLRLVPAPKESKPKRERQPKPPKLLSLDGVTQPVDEWAADYGIPASLIAARIAKGWNEERAITTPMRVPKGFRL
jgi:hypothetical protein